MLVDYAKQETLEPLKNLGKYLGFGIAGAILVFAGVFFTGLATLRLMQSLDTSRRLVDVDAAYLIAIGVLLVALLFIALSLSRARRKVLS